MAGTVQVTFGANIAPLVEGVESARKAIESFMAAFAVDRLAEFAEAYAKMGDQIDAAAHQFGASTTQIQQLGYMAKMAGGDQQTLTDSFARLEQTLQLAQNPTTRQAQALQALGLSTRQLIGLPLQQQLEVIADSFAKLGDGTNKAAIAQALFRNASGEMIEMLDQGGAGMRALSDQAERTGAIMSSQTVSALAATDHAAVELKASLSTLAGEVVALASSTLVSFANELAQDAGDLTKLAEAGQLGVYMMADLKLNAELVTMRLVQFGEALGNLSSIAGWTRLVSEWKSWQQQIAETTRSGEAGLATVQSAADAAYQKMLAVQESSNKPQAPAMDVMGRDTLNAMLSNINAQVAAQNSYYEQQVDHINELAKLSEVTEAQKTAMLLAAVNQREAMQEAELQQAMNLGGLTAAQYQKLQDELTKVQQKAGLDRQKINEQEVNDYQKDWQSALTAVESSFNSQLRGLLAGTETWHQAWNKMLGDMIIKFIEMCEQAVARWAAKELAETTATIAGANTRAAAENSAAATSDLAMLGNAIKAIVADAAQAFGGVFAFLAPTMGPAAAAPAAAAQASVLAAVPALAVGTDYVTRGGFALLHAGEKVTPAQTSGPYSGADASSIKGLLASHREQMGQMTDAVSRSMGGLENEFYQLRRKLGR
jgi:hypothetical protein